MTEATKPSRSRWNYLPPEMPISQAPFCEWPIRPLASVAYVLKSWLPAKDRFYYLLAAVGIWVWFTPSLDRARTFQMDWMFEIWLRNFILVLVLAGGMHLWLFTFARQGEDVRYDARPLARNNKVFHFGNQVWDNMFWTLVSSVPVGTLWECLLLWAYANGHATLVTFGENPAWFVGLLILVPFWSGFHFYWFHRALHMEPLYTWFHSWHHKNTTTGPWSGHAMHPVEHIGLYSDVALYFFIASHPVHLIFNLMLHTIGGPVSHCGFDKLKIGRATIHVGDFMHQLHHRFFDCNYGTYETPWDRIFNSFHDGTPAGDAFIGERRRRLNAKPD